MVSFLGGLPPYLYATAFLKWRGWTFCLSSAIHYLQLWLLYPNGSAEINDRYCRPLQSDILQGHLPQTSVTGSS